MTLAVTFWGTRGTIPSPGPATVRYGGNTACVAVRDDSGRMIVLDAGTGIRALGRALPRSGASRVDILLSHVHWDHIQGLPFFAPLYASGVEVHIHGPAPEGRSLAEVLEGQVDAAVFPVPRSQRSARVVVHQLAAGEAPAVPGFRIRTCPLSHPGGAVGFRLGGARGGPEVAYLTDNELGPGGSSRVSASWRESVREFVGGASLLVHDAMYTPVQASARSGWGHSSVLEAAELGRAAGVRALALFHHDPDHDDAQVDALLEMARTAAPGLALSAAAEGTTVTL